MAGHVEVAKLSPSASICLFVLFFCDLSAIAHQVPEVFARGLQAYE